jgi:hypothetical protein
MKIKITFLLILIFAVLTLSFSLVSAANACCEKTTNGAWCQNTQSENCDASFRQAPTSCEATSYCKKGCCYDSQEGLCMENTPQKICQNNNGSWSNSADCSISQCSLGCCVLGDQAALVTKVRCKTLSSFYGLVTDFRSTITDELTCLAEATSEEEGACVYEDSPGHNTCSFGKRSECDETISTTTTTINTTGNETEITSTELGTTRFYDGKLCTAPDLDTDCQKSKITMLVEGKDEVYYVDTCGQKANIYDSSRYDDDLYWTYIVEKAESCGAGTSNAGSKTCGNCDYYLGSIGKEAAWNANPTYGDYICSSLDCDEHKHGESWCVYDSPRDYGQDTVGSRDFKEVCVDGEVLQEPCADFRNEICVEGKSGSYNEARCTVNKWQDCLQQSDQEDCVDINTRDCYWKEGYYYDTNTSKILQSTNETDEYGIYLTSQGVCLPRHPPGFTFWSSSSSTQSTSNIGGSFSVNSTGSFGTGYVQPTSSISSSDMCSVGDSVLKIKYIKTERPADFLKLYGDDSDWECLGLAYGDKYDSSYCALFQSSEKMKEWASEMNSICYSLGDCGGYTNWIGVYTQEGFAAYNNSLRFAGSGSSQILGRNYSAGTAAQQTTTTGSSGSSASTTDSLVSGTQAVSSVASTVGSFTGDVVRDFIKNIYGGK